MPMFGWQTGGTNWVQALFHQETASSSEQHALNKQMNFHMETVHENTNLEDLEGADPSRSCGCHTNQKKNLLHLEARETLRESAVVNTMQTPPAPSLPPQNDPHTAVTYIALPSTALAPRSTRSQHRIISGSGSPRSNYCRQLLQALWNSDGLRGQCHNQGNV